MGMSTYVIKSSSKILPLSFLFVDIYLQDWSPLCADVVFTRDTFHSNPKKNWCFSAKTRRTKMKQRKAKDRFKTLRVITRFL